MQFERPDTKFNVKNIANIDHKTVVFTNVDVINAEFTSKYTN